MTTSSTSSSPQGEDGATTAAVLSLGKRIAESLDDRDLLSRWMAHHLAARIESLRALNEADRVLAEDEVALLILRIWERRQGAKQHDDPLALADKVRRALVRLDPSARGPFGFYRPFEEDAGPTDVEIETNNALKLALEIDNAAGRLVSALFSYASAHAINEDAEWVAASRASGAQSFDELVWLASGFRERGESEGKPGRAERLRIAEAADALGKAVQPLAEFAVEAASSDAEAEL